jgi:Zn-dependent protease
MLGWSINLFRVRGIQLAVHFSFFLLLAYVAEVGWREDGASGLIWSVVTLLAFFTCVVLHELGHSFTAMSFGIGVRRILLMPIGGMAEFEGIPREPYRELLITAAGPAVNFAIATALWIIVGLPQGWHLSPGFYDFPANATGFWQLLLHWNLLMGLFNLAPVFPMDGGRILRALLATRRPYMQATAWAAGLGKILASVAVVIALFAFERPQLLPAALFAFIFLAGEAEYRAAQRREREDAEWRELRARAYALPRRPPIEEPPLLPR